MIDDETDETHHCGACHRIGLCTRESCTPLVAQTASPEIGEPEGKPEEGEL